MQEASKSASVFEEPGDALATAAEMLLAEEMYEAAKVLRVAEFSFELTGFDNWNGGTNMYTLFLKLPAIEYVRLKPRMQILEKQIQERLEPIISQQTDEWFSLRIVPRVERQQKWRRIAGGIPQEIRQNIFDGLRLEGVHWAGVLEDADFLGRIFALEELPSSDSRFSNAAQDIWQHRVSNPLDWPDDWVFSDPRFDLTGCSDATFMRFISEVLHPVVRPDRNESVRLAKHFNDQLRPTGWALVEEDPIAGRPRYVGRQVSYSGSRADFRARSVADSLDASWMHREIQRLEAAVERDPALAIGTAKDLLESCCKTILSRLGESPSKSDDIPKLTKAVLKNLKLVPDDIPERARGAETIKVLLSNLAALSKGLAELRGLYGSGHGRDGRHKGLEPRHARLAVGAAVAFIDFVAETFHRRQLSRESEEKAQE